MVFEYRCDLVVWMKVASALEGLILVRTAGSFEHDKVNIENNLDTHERLPDVSNLALKTNLDVLVSLSTYKFAHNSAD